MHNAVKYPYMRACTCIQWALNHGTVMVPGACCLTGAGLLLLLLLVLPVGASPYFLSMSSPESMASTRTGLRCGLLAPGLLLIQEPQGICFLKVLQCDNALKVAVGVREDSSEACMND